MNFIRINLIFMIICVQKASVSRSPDRLASLANSEMEIYNILNELSNMKENNLLLKEYITDFNESTLRVIKYLDNMKDTIAVTISNNPIVSYRMIRRYANMLRTIYKGLTPKLKQDVLRKLQIGKNEDEIFIEWPTILDVKDAMEALLRIYYVYDIKLEEFTLGNIMGTETNVGLNAKQCKEIGEFAIDIKQFTSGIEWLEMALIQTDKSSEFAKEIVKSLQMAMETHDVAWNSKTPRELFYYQARLNETKNENKKSLRKTMYEDNKGKGSEWYYENAISWGVCSGETYQTNQEMSQLFCWYETKTNLAWTINPMKIEQLSISPYLIQIYDILNNKTIDEIKKDSRSRLRRSPRFVLNYVAINQDNAKSTLSDKFIQTYSFARYIELITGLKVDPTNTVEKFGISVYPYGGHSSYHIDYLDSLQIYDHGNRMATIIFYLEDVKIGGFTAFPKIGVAGKPIKGSAIFWYNMLKNGDKDERTYHTSCPVVIGQKWILIKIIRVNAQIWSRPCSLNSDQ